MNPHLRARLRRIESQAGTIFAWLFFFTDLILGASMIWAKTQEWAHNYPILYEVTEDNKDNEMYRKSFNVFKLGYFFYFCSAKHFYYAHFLEAMTTMGKLEDETKFPNLKRASEFFYGSAEGSVWIGFFMIVIEVSATQKNNPKQCLTPPPLHPSVLPLLRLFTGWVSYIR
jgi:hypothetical protein